MGLFAIYSTAVLNLTEKHWVKRTIRSWFLIDVASEYIPRESRLRF